MKKLLPCPAAAAITLAIASASSPAMADDCLLDRDNDGVVDAATDNDGGANSADLDTSTACGTGAVATGSFATAIGSLSAAIADRTVAVGRISEAGFVRANAPAGGTGVIS